MPRLLALLIGLTATCGIVGCSRGSAPPPTPAAAPAATTVQSGDDATGPSAEPVTAAGQPEGLAETSTDPADTGDSGEPPEPNGFETPEAAFAAAQQAARDRDWRSLVACMTPDGQHLLAGVMMFAAAFGGDEAAPLLAVIEKHGVELPKPEFSVTLGDGAETPEPEESPDEPEIEDLPGFIADMLVAMEASNMDKGPGAGPEQWGNAELTDLTIDGDSANATLTIPTDDGEQTEPIAFTKTDAGWLIDVAVTSGPGGPMVGGAFSSDETPSEPLAESVLENGLKSTIALTFEQPFEQEFFGKEFPNGSLYVTLKLTGEPILDTYEYGEFQVVTAEDDTGTTLKLAGPVVNGFGKEFGDEFIELNKFFLDQKDTLPIRFALTPPGEGAEQLDSLELSVKLKVREPVVVKDVMSHVGGTVDVENVGELSINTWSGISDGKPDHGLVIRGPAETLQGVTLLRGDGSVIKPKETSGSGGQFGIYTGAALPEDTQMRISLGGTEKIQVVPLKFEDLDLKR